MKATHATTSDPLGLRQLPPRRAPAGLWSAIEQQLEAPPARHSRARWSWAGAAVAALLAALVLPRVWWNADLPATARSPRDGVASIGNEAAPSEADRGARLQSARAVSALLENDLQRARGEVLRPADMGELVWIEAELRLTDDLLGDDPDNLELWHQRIALLGRMNYRYQRNDWRRQLQLTRL